MRRAWVPIGCALAQGIVVITPGGAPDRAGWAHSLASLVGIASGAALWRRNDRPVATTVLLAYTVVVVAAAAAVFVSRDPA